MSMPRPWPNLAKGKDFGFLGQRHLRIRSVGVAPISRAILVCSASEIQDSISSNHLIQGD